MLFEKIETLKSEGGLSKHEILVQGVKETIDAGELVRGSHLPSVNKMMVHTGYARQTIVKAYLALKDSGIIESKNRLGYFIASENTGQEMKVALLLYAFHTFQEIFYNTFRESLGEHIKIDVFFHHNNPEIFESIVNSISGKYGMYVIAPIQDIATPRILNTLPKERLLLVDRFIDTETNYSHVTQEFERSLFNALVNLESTIKQYDEFILFFKEKTDYPMEVLKAFQLFCRRYNIKNQVHRKYSQALLQKGKVYCTIGDNDLWGILKDAKAADYEIGKDVGILSHNDTPVKEIISNGITTFSTDFHLMAQRAAHFIKTKAPLKETIPSILIRRNSL